MKTKRIYLTLFFIIVCLLRSNAQVPSFYGMTYQGGASNYGVIFKTDANGNNQSLVYSFTVQSEGQNPYGSLVQASNGKLYGMTQAGGTNSLGVLFEYNPSTNTYTKKLDFSGTADGQNPVGSLMQASNGKLYGMTSQGGTNGYGVLFEYDPSTSAYTKKLDFSGTADGQFLTGSLMQASNGKLYGMAFLGGANSFGVLFEYDPSTNTYTKKLDFSGTANGRNPYGDLVQASNGKLYGMTSVGGTNNMGVLFEYDPSTNTYTKKLDFSGTADGQNPSGSLMQASNGKLYGMTSAGGTNNMGVLFEYNPSTNTYTKKLDFSGTADGRVPGGSLMQASNGKLYGMTAVGGTNNLGVLFEYDPSTNTYTKTLDFSGTADGKMPQLGHLIEVTCASTGLRLTNPSSSGEFVADGLNIETQNLRVYPNPNNGEFVVECAENSHIAIMNILGQVVLEQHTTSSKTSFSINSLENGIYFVKVISSKGQQTTVKMIKQ